MSWLIGGFKLLSALNMLSVHDLPLYLRPPEDDCPLCFLSPSIEPDLTLWPPDIVVFRVDYCISTKTRLMTLRQVPFFKSFLISQFLKPVFHSDLAESSQNPAVDNHPSAFNAETHHGRINIEMSPMP